MGLIWLGAAWLAGIALGYGRDPRPWWPVALWLGVALVAGAALARRGRAALLWAALALACLALASWRTTLVAPAAAALPEGAIEALRGEVADWPARGDRGDTAIVAVAAVRIDGTWRDAGARVRADLPTAPQVWRGDRVELYGYYRPTGAIDPPGFRDWLARRGLAGQFRAFGARVSEEGERASPGARRFAALHDLEGRLRRHIPGAEGALATGVLLGDDRLLPKGTRDAFDATSTAHTTALSGYNITLIAGLCALIGRALRRARARPWLIGSALAIWAFVAFVGPGPTLLRAAIMGTVYLLAEALGRRGDALAALALAAVAMTAWDPATLLDIGFQLSCAATVGLIVAAPPLAGALGRLRLPRPIALGAATTLAAEIATLPLIVHHFGRVSRVTLPANLLVEPLVPAIMLLAALAGAASYLFGPLADLLGLIAWVPARLMLLVVESLGSLPWATQRLPAPGWPLTLALYALGGAATVAARRWPEVRRRLAAGPSAQPRPLALPFGAGLLGGLALGAWLVVLR